MYNRIVVCLALDHALSASALAVARSLKNERGQIIVLHIIEQPDSSIAAYIDEAAMNEMQERAETAVAQQVAGNPDVEAVIRMGHPGRTISEYATEVKADCIIMGSHKPEISDFFLGSTAARVVRHAPCAVHVLR